MEQMNDKLKNFHISLNSNITQYEWQRRQKTETFEELEERYCFNIVNRQMYESDFKVSL